MRRSIQSLAAALLLTGLLVGVLAALSSPLAGDLFTVFTAPRTTPPPAATTPSVPLLARIVCP